MLIRLVELLSGEVTFIPKRLGEPDCTFADVTKIKKILKWESNTSLEKGVRIMLKNIDYWKEAPAWNEENVKEATKDWFKYLT